MAAGAKRAEKPENTAFVSLDVYKRQNSGIVNSIALLGLPAAGNTVSNLCKDSSKYTFTLSFTANGHTDVYKRQ